MSYLEPRLRTACAMSVVVYMRWLECEDDAHEHQTRHYLSAIGSLSIRRPNPPRLTGRAEGDLATAQRRTSKPSVAPVNTRNTNMCTAPTANSPRAGHSIV